MRDSLYVSEWTKQQRKWFRRCSEPGCYGHLWYCRDEWQGDCSWGCYQCDVCGAGFKQAGVWTDIIPQQSKPPCRGIELEPGKFSGCDARVTGAADCPSCGPAIDHIAAEDEQTERRDVHEAPAAIAEVRQGPRDSGRLDDRRRAANIDTHKHTADAPALGLKKD